LNGKPSEAIPYMDPTSNTVKDHPKASGDDYVDLPALNTYETLDYQMQVPDTPYQYELAADTSVFKDSIKDSTVGEALPDNEQIYEDPGYKKENLCLV